MTRDEARRAWLEEKIDDASGRTFDEHETSFEATCTRGHMTGEEAHAFACGWDWAVEMVKKESAALLDAPLRELEEAMEYTGLTRQPCHCDTKIAYWCESCRVKAALARLPWREEGTT